jgi:hypothetical protein
VFIQHFISGATLDCHADPIGEGRQR